MVVCRLKPSHLSLMMNQPAERTPEDQRFTLAHFVNLVQLTVIQVNDQPVVVPHPRIVRSAYLGGAGLHEGRGSDSTARPSRRGDAG